MSIKREFSSLPVSVRTESQGSETPNPLATIPGAEGLSSRAAAALASRLRFRQDAAQMNISRVVETPEGQK